MGRHSPVSRHGSRVQALTQPLISNRDGASIMASATQLPLCGTKAPQHRRKKAFEDSSFYPEWPIR
jgi:hypothetical protein